jgi:gliding motility-associated-like protein
MKDMKKNYFVHIVAASLSFLCSIMPGTSAAQTCSLTASAANPVINCGQSTQLTANGLGGQVIMNNDFNLGSAGPGWTTTSGAQYNNPCGTGPGGAHMWMGSGSAAPRLVSTIGFNTSCGGTVCFDFRMAVQGGASPCEGPDAVGEGIYFQYSIDGGATWVTINYFDPAPSGGTDPMLTNWNNYCFAIPAAAMTANTMFRWAQTSVSSNLNDHWGIDNVQILSSCGSPYYYVWSPAASLSSSTGATITASPLATTTYTVLYTNGINDTCMSTVTVTVNGPTSNAGPGTTICAGQSTTLQGTATAGNTLNNPVTFTNNTSVPIQDVATTTSVMNVTGLNNPVLTTNSVASVCVNIQYSWDSDLDLYLQCPSGTILELSTDNGGAGQNYTNTCFTLSATTPVASGAAPFTGNYIPEGAGGLNAFSGCNGNGSWTLIMTDDLGGFAGTLLNWNLTINDFAPAPGGFTWSPTTNMTNSNTLTPTVAPLTTTTYYLNSFNPNAPGCTALDSVTVFVIPGSPVSAGSDVTICPGDTTQLNTTVGFGYAWSPAAGLSSSTVQSPMASPSATTSYTVAVTDGNGCINWDTVVVNILPRPNISAGSDVATCTGDTITLSATGGVSYSWSPSSSLTGANTATPSALPPATTSYTVIGTDQNGCTNSDTVLLSLSPLPVTMNAPSTVCSGSQVQLSASSPGGISYTWGPASSLSSTTAQNPIATPTVTTTYIVTVSNGNGCINTNSVTITTNPLPNADAGASVAVCQGTGTVLSASGGSTYVWSPASGLSSTNSSNTNATPATTTTYTVTVTDGNGCVNTDMVTVTVNPLPAANAGPNASVCQGSSAQLNATGGVQYAWSPATGLSATNIANPLASPTVLTTYTVTVTSAGGCINTDAVTVIVNPTPAANAGADAFVCQGGSTQLTANNLSGATYNWSPPSGLNNAGIMNPIATPPATTVYTVTVTNAGGCSATDMVTVTVNNAPTPSLTSQDAVCGDDDGQITASPVGNFFYSLNGGSPQTSPVFTNLSPGTYTITVTDTIGCTGTQTTTVGQVNNANASFIASPLTGQVPLPVSFTNNSTGANTYYWDFGNGSSTTTQNGSAIYTTGGTYQVMLIVYNNNSACADTAMVTIIAEELVAIEIPNVFTPNGDGKNDMFVLKSEGLSQINGEIFNRWGKRVSEWSGSPSTGWDGKTDSGAEAEDGVYYYMITTISLGGDVQEHKGFVQLIRNK